MSETFENIIKKILTKEDLVFFLEEINLTKGLIFKDIKTPLSKKLKGKVSEDFENYLQELEKKGLASQSPSQQLEFFEKIKKTVQELPQIKLEIAFQPSNNFLLKVKEWLKEATGQEMILDVTQNPELVGGVTVEYRGKYINLSLAKKIDELLSEKRL